MTIEEEITRLGKQALTASRDLALLSSVKKNEILVSMADELDARREALASENAKDLAEGESAGLSPAMLDRLRLSDGRIDGMIAGIREVCALPDPVGDCLSEITRPNGLRIKKVRVPIGVIGIIYESRPNVTADATVLCFKASNAVILRGGKEAIHSNRAIAEAIQAGGEKAGLPPHSVQLVQTTDRAAVKALVQLEDYLDLVIPRGGESLIRAVTEMARVPVIKHYKGVCHTYLHQDADRELAKSIPINAKCDRPAVCNAMETLLVHEALAAGLLPELCAEFEEKGVELRGDEAARAIRPSMKAASEADWYEEYNDLVLSIRIVSGVDEAIEHINHFGSHHSDAIVTSSPEVGDRFLQAVDSATVYVNASTRFTDGNEFGLGAEIGISTDKLHARGPMGLEELTSYKYLIYGEGQVR